MQNQIFFLCSEVFDDEWSGTLFYTVEGELGEDNFKITAKELYLQDIGNAIYTEYDPGNPTFIKFLMENPDFLTMKQGHIHSHNKMSVFFSSTDMDEIRDNSEFHNYYLSLIVNNKNEMTAKVAFRATEKRETKSIVSFRGGDGQMRQKEVTGETEEASVYHYSCDIEVPDVVGESFSQRFLGIQKENEEKKKLAKQAEKISKDLEGGKKEINPYAGWSGEKAYRQAGLYDDVKEEGRGRKDKKEGQKAYKRGQLVLPPDYGTRREWSGSVDTDYDRKRQYSGEAKGSGKADPRTYSFLVKLLNRDFLSEGTLGAIMMRLNNDFYSPEYNPDGPADDKNLYFDSLDDLSITYYVDSFPEDFGVAGFPRVMESAILLVECYQETYPELVLDLVEALTFAIDA